MDLRYALYRTLEEAQEALVGLAARPHPESRRILSLAQRAFGGLRGLIMGLSVDLAGRAPAPGEWSVREVLGHMALVEQRYAIHTAYAVERADSEPVRIPDSRLPPLTPSKGDETIDELLARLGEARAETDRRLADLPPAALTRPTVWAQCDVDVRFRLHRFAAHLTEHTVQCEKALAALGWQPPEGTWIVREIGALLGEIEGLGGLRELGEIGDRLAERAAG